MSNLTLRTFRGKSYSLPFTPSAPLHIPASMMEPPAGFNIQWDFNGQPFFYYRNRLGADCLDAEVTLDPETGKESVNVSLNLDEATAEETRAALGELLEWFRVAVESHLPIGGEK